ncbi:MAG: HAMP domain-containing sensor histidine kinase [Meiothermus sp.]|nr:HAMP domain-containing sensor histidine kinase [Meiothermus sp.]
MPRTPQKYWQGERWVWVAFVVVVVFLVAQVGWWMIFQRNLIQQSIEYASTTWLQEAALVQQLWQASDLSRDPAGRERLAQELRQQFPQLRIEGEQVFVDPVQMAAYRNQQLRHLRMLAYEGPFFLLIMLLGLWIIARSLRREQALKRRHRNFLMAATHEFRTPIGTIRLMLETLQMRELTPEKRLSYLENMHNELNRLEALSERLLATARLERGLDLPKHEIQNLAVVLSEKVQALRPTLETRGAQIILETPPDHLPVELDLEAFGLVLSNLLENALKYSLSAEKPIWVRVETRDNQALIKVEDRGVGVSREALPHLFEPFYRAGDEQTRETSGMGLGLYLVRSLMALMNGSVSCEPLEQGTRFTLALPLAQTPLSAPIRSPA